MYHDPVSDVPLDVGMEIEHMARERVHLDVDQLVELYESGESVKAIAERVGVTRRTIDKRLRARGVEPRTAGEQQLIRYARTTPEERRAIAAHAFEAKRGRPNSPEALERAARTREAGGQSVSRGEAMMADWLHERGMLVRPQVAIGKYNADLGVEPVAVEIFGGNWHGSGRHARRFPARCHDVLHRGWSLVIVWDQTRCPMRVEAADKVVAFYEAIRRNPPAVGEYRVLRGDGELLSAGRGELNDGALVPSQCRC